jgi:exonuclease VII large subunit
MSFPPTDVAVLSIGELTRSIKNLLETAHGQVWVEGEVSNLARPASGHVYLTLKDAEAPLKTVVYRGVAMRMKFDLRDGQHVVARGRVTVYPPRGEYQFQVEEIQPKGIGPLELAFRQLKEKLSVLGYFEPGRKKRLPPVPSRICLVTSGTGSAVRDMLQVLNRRWPAVDIWVCPVRVQGEGAAEDIAGALMLLNRLGGPESPSAQRIDVILLGRGWRKPRGSVEFQRGDRRAGHSRIADSDSHGDRPRGRSDHRGPGRRCSRVDPERGGRARRARSHADSRKPGGTSRSPAWSAVEATGTRRQPPE